MGGNRAAIIIDLIAIRGKAIKAGALACQYDEDNRYPEALKMYIESIEYYQHLLKCTSSSNE